MLVLTRKEGESIVLDTPQGKITIVVVEARDHHGAARIGIDAPRDVPIWREEIRPKPPEDTA